MPVVEWRPETSDVARLLLERLGRAIDDDVAIGDDFTASTTPTQTQVEGFIDIAVIDVAAKVRVAIIESQVDQARNVAAYWASVLAELSRVPAGAADEDVSVAPQYEKAYADSLVELKAACRTRNTRLA